MDVQKIYKMVCFSQVACHRRVNMTNVSLQETALEKLYTFIILYSSFLTIICTTHSMLFQLFKGSRGSSVGTVSDYGLDGRGSIPDSGGGFFF
jgi:hypothetical protein